MNESDTIRFFSDSTTTVFYKNWSIIGAICVDSLSKKFF